MNIVDFWKRQTDLWNTEEKCGFCWEFSAPLIESAVNLVQSEEETKCCVKVMFLQDKAPAFSTTNNFSSTTQLLNGSTCTENFQILVLMDSKLGINNYNEIKGHSVEESNWETIMNPLKECLSCDANLAFCELLGTRYRITQWSGVQVMNYTGSVYCGYRISVTFQNIN